MVDRSCSVAHQHHGLELFWDKSEKVLTWLIKHWRHALVGEFYLFLETNKKYSIITLILLLVFLKDHNFLHDVEAVIRMSLPLQQDNSSVL